MWEKNEEKIRIVSGWQSKPPRRCRRACARAGENSEWGSDGDGGPDLMEVSACRHRARAVMPSCRAVIHAKTDDMYTNTNRTTALRIKLRSFIFTRIILLQS